MTEEEWLECSDPKPMLVFIRDKAADRKKRLFACAACRQIWPLLESIGKQAIEFAEQYAEGESTTEELSRIENLAWWAADALNYEDDSIWYAGWAAHSAVSDKPIETIAFRAEATKSQNMAPLCDLGRDIFGNPFRTVAIDRRWLTSTVTDLAQGIYADRAFDRMPILADALQDSGCENAELLEHCRGPGPHVRGCWVLDLLLGKG